MIDNRLRPPAPDRANPQAIVPDAQARALDRRHALNQQQRAFREALPVSRSSRPRPPC